MSIQRLTMIVLMIVGTVPMASASDELYVCADGTFTNRVELRCPAYESKGIVRMQPRTAVPSNDTVKRDDPKMPSADVKPLRNQ